MLVELWGMDVEEWSGAYLPMAFVSLLYIVVWFARPTYVASYGFRYDSIE